MAAPDAWMAFLTLGTGVAVTAQLSGQTMRRLATLRRGRSGRQPGAGNPDADPELSFSATQSGVSVRGELVGDQEISMTEVGSTNYVALGGEPERA
jgi:hypothetical protein